MNFVYNLAMCGIFGVIHFNNTNNDSKEYINKTIGLFRYRGPDQKGVYIDKRVSFGHVRLSIIDLSDNAIQPMMDHEKDFVIIFNGEIYNYMEIRKILLKKGYKFLSNSDTEVIINSFKEWGEEAVNKFNGMFSFALYNRKTGSVWVYRDRFGIKPLFFYFSNDKFIFSSEPRPIVYYLNKKFDVEPIAISSFFSFRYPLKDLSFFKGIKTLIPGHYIKVLDNRFEIKKYFTLKINSELEDKGENFYIHKIRELITTSVKRRMISDVPYGAYLSGGIDSSIIVSIMSKNSSFPIKTFTIGFKDRDFNEFYFARQISQHYSTEHYEIDVDFNDYIEAHEKISSMKGSPVGVPNEPLIYILSKYLKRYITVVLSGEGSDEIFGGYGRIFRSPDDFYKIKILNEISNRYKELLKNEFLLKLKSKLEKKYNQIELIDNPLKHFLSIYPYVQFRDKVKIFSADFLNEIKNDSLLIDIFREEFKTYNIKDLSLKYMIIFEKLHLPGLLLRLDNATMAASVEGRVPFVDHELVETVINIPTRYKIKWKSESHKFISQFKISDEISENYDIPKYILKKAFNKDIPEEIINRKKMGFPVPLEQWQNRYFKEKITELIIENKRAKERGIYNLNGIKEMVKENRREFSRIIFSLVSLELWFNNYYDNLLRR